MKTENAVEKEKAAEKIQSDADEQQGAPRGIVREYFESAVVTIIMALFFMTFVAQAATVPSASMENTILVGDHFLINKFIFAPGPQMPFLPQRDIRRGDIIVFKYPSDIDTNEEIVQYKTFFIKRVIGLPGETIQVRGSEVLINGQALPEHRIMTDDRDLGNKKAELTSLRPSPKTVDSLHSVYYSNFIEDDMRSSSSDLRFGVSAPYPLKDDEYFVMGDNRDNSKDSRFWGPVKRDLVVGRAMFVIWSYDESKPKNQGLLGPVVNLINNSRWSRIGTRIQ